MGTIELYVRKQKQWTIDIFNHPPHFFSFFSHPFSSFSLPSFWDFACKADFPIAIHRLLLCSLQIYIWEAKFTKADTGGITAVLASKKFVSFVSSFHSNVLDQTPTAPQPYQLPCLSRIFRQCRKQKHLLLAAFLPASSQMQKCCLFSELSKLLPTHTFSHGNLWKYTIWRHLCMHWKIIISL